MQGNAERGIAISNRRLVTADQHHVTFRYKDYRADHAERWKTMKLGTDEFIRRFLSHVLPKRFHRIRHYGLLANGNRAANIDRARQLLAVPVPQNEPEVQEAASSDEATALSQPCPCCGGRMVIIETFEAGSKPGSVPTTEGIDSS